MLRQFRPCYFRFDYVRPLKAMLGQVTSCWAMVDQVISG